MMPSGHLDNRSNATLGAPTTTSLLSVSNMFHQSVAHTGAWMNPFMGQFLHLAGPPLLSVNPSYCALLGTTPGNVASSVTTDAPSLLPPPLSPKRLHQQSPPLSAKRTTFFRPWQDDDKPTSVNLPTCSSGSEEEATTANSDDDPEMNRQAALETITTNLGKTLTGHRCLYCGKEYSRKYGLKIHLRTHTGFKPLRCKVCRRAFGDPSNLNKHTRLHSDGTSGGVAGGVSFKCHLCGKMLVRKRDLDRHLISRHDLFEPIEHMAHKHTL